MRKNLVLFTMIVIMLVIPLVNAIDEPSYTFKRGESIDLKLPCYNETYSPCANTALCNITIMYPNSTVFVNNKGMTWNAAYFNYTFKSYIQGEYYATTSCFSTSSGFSTFTFEITPSGFSGTGTFYWIILVISAGLMILGFWIKDGWITIFGGLVMFSIGIYTIFYGIADIRDNYVTWGIALVEIGIAAYITINSGLELMNE